MIEFREADWLSLQVKGAYSFQNSRGSEVMIRCLVHTGVGALDLQETEQGKGYQGYGASRRNRLSVTF